MHCIYALLWIFCEYSSCKCLRYFLNFINAVQTRGKKSQKAAIAHFQKFMKHWQLGIRCLAYNWSTFIFCFPEGRFFTYSLGLYYTFFILYSIFSFLLTYLILVLYSTSLLGPIFAKSANFLLFSQTSFASLLVFVKKHRDQKDFKVHLFLFFLREANERRDCWL